MLDFPAAHSMDTYWFAIDAEENIAVFGTGEAGALPHSAQEIDIDLIRNLPRDDRGIINPKTDGKIAATGATAEYIDLQVAYPVNCILDCLIPFDPILDNLILVLSDEDAISKLRSQGDRILRFAGDPVVIYIEKCSKRKLAKLFKSGEVLAGKDVNILELNPLIGLFSYRHDDECENWIAGPYLQNGRPEKPLKLKELPTHIQELISRTHFEELRFQDTERLQPIDYTKCDTWGDSSWRDTKGKIHEHLPNI